MRAVEQLVPLLMEAGEVERALGYAQRAVSADPLSEAATFNLMRALAAAGLPSQAMVSFRQLEERLREAGGEPSAALQAYARSELTRDSAHAVPLPTMRPAIVPAMGEL